MWYLSSGEWLCSPADGQRCALQLNADPLGGGAKVMELIRALLTLVILAGSSAAALAGNDEAFVSSGCSGGFTGGGGGVVVHRDGAIHRWSKPTYRDPVKQSFVRLDPAAARELFAALERINFTSIRYNKHGNMTCRVTLRQGGSTHGVAWPHGDPTAPSEVVALASRMEQVGQVPPLQPK